MRSSVQVAAAVAIVVSGAWYLAADRTYEYEQTWPESYAATSCHEWRTAMTSDERYAAAADLLQGSLEAEGRSEDLDFRRVSDWRDVIEQRCADTRDTTLEDVSAGQQ